MHYKDTFLFILERLTPKKIPELRLVCKKWRQWIDEAPWSWEAQEPFAKAKHWHVKLGRPLEGYNYSLIYQLGERRWPGLCTMLCVREIDQVIEVKTLDVEGNTTLCTELIGLEGKVTIIRELQHKRFAVGYKHGKLLIWNSKQLERPLLEISVFEITILQVVNLCRQKIKLESTGIIKSTEEDFLIVSDINGNLTCLDISRDVSKPITKWRCSLKHPIMDFRAEDDDHLCTVSYDDFNNDFMINVLSIHDGSKSETELKISRPLRSESMQLKHAKFYPNGNITDFEFQKDGLSQCIGQTVTVNTYILRTINDGLTVKKYYVTHNSVVDINYNSFWAKPYILEDTFAFASTSALSECETTIVYPKRLPITRVSLPPSNNNNYTNKKTF